MKRIRVLLVDDHPLFRQGVRWTLDPEHDIEVVGEAADGQTALQIANSLQPDVVLCDINMPGMDGLEVTRILKRQQPRVMVIILTLHQDDEQLFNAIRAGASAYAFKDIAGAEIVSLIRRVGRGEYLINDGLLARPAVAARVLDQFRDLSTLEEGEDRIFSPLTPRELEMLEWVARGNSNKEIARALAISDQTVKNHVTAILRKLAVNDRTQAVIYALRHGWIKLDDQRGEAPPALGNR